jgi:tripartite-type tricarboxylate transporter receptor subunit TctC
MISPRFVGFLVTALLALFATLPVAAQQPAAAPPIRLIVPAPPGGGTDVFARLLAELAGPELGREIVVNNVAGASGAVGVTLLTTAPPDGDTIAFVWNGPLTAAPLTLPVTYSTQSYKAVMSIGYSSYVLCAPADKVGDSGDYISTLKSSVGLTYGNDGSGGTMQLAAERLFRKLGARIQAVPFSGAGEVARNFADGFIDIYGGSITPILGQVKDGKAKCFLLTAAGRNGAVPHALGLDELGLEAETTVLWWGLIAPARTPPETLAALQAAFVAAAASERFQAEMVKQGAVSRILDGAETMDLITAESIDLERVARDLGLLRFGR